MKKTILFPLLLACTFCTGRHEYSHRNLIIAGLPAGISSVACGNLTGSKQDELILVRDSTLLIYSVESDSVILIDSVRLSGDQMLMKVGDIDGDRRNELVVLTGWRRYVNSSVAVYLVGEENGKFKARELLREGSARPQPVSLLISDADNDGFPEIMASWFESKYFVKTDLLSIRNGSWNIEEYTVERMAMSRDVAGLPGSNGNQYVVGRVYGDSLGLDGDAYTGKTEKKPLPVKRGVKTIKIGDGDNDGINEIFVGDGWHFDYGKIARSRLAVVRQEQDGYSYQLIEDVKYQYELSQIEIADLTGNGKNEVVTRGNRFFRLYRKDPDGWKVFTDTLIPVTQFAIGNITGDKHPEVVFAGKELQVWQFARPVFTTGLGEEVKTELQQPDSLVGKPAPELSILSWYNGNFSGMTNNRGKVILLDYWATWCKPCIQTFPTLRKWQEKYGEQGLQILGLTRIDDRQTQQDVAAFAEKEKFAYPVGLSAESHNHLAYGVGAIPHVVLIDRKGIVRHFQVGSGNEKNLEGKLLELLKE